eukprot:1198724-Rhodomonas_salina.1
MVLRQAKYACPWEACSPNQLLSTAPNQLLSLDHVLAIHRQWDAMDLIRPHARDAQVAWLARRNQIPKPQSENRCFYQGRTLLHISASTGDMSNIKTLLDIGFDPGDTDLAMLSPVLRCRRLVRGPEIDRGYFSGYVRCRDR